MVQVGGQGPVKGYSAQFQDVQAQKKTTKSEKFNRFFAALGKMLGVRKDIQQESGTPLRSKAIRQLASIQDKTDYSKLDKGDVRKLIGAIKSEKDLVHFCINFNPGRLAKAGIITEDQHQMLNNLFDQVANNNPSLLANVNKESAFSSGTVSELFQETFQAPNTQNNEIMGNVIHEACESILADPPVEPGNLNKISMRCETAKLVATKEEKAGGHGTGVGSKPRTWDQRVQKIILNRSLDGSKSIIKGINDKQKQPIEDATLDDWFELYKNVGESPRKMDTFINSLSKFNLQSEGTKESYKTFLRLTGLPELGAATELTAAKTEKGEMPFVVGQETRAGTAEKTGIKQKLKQAATITDKTIYNDAKSQNIFSEHYNLPTLPGQTGEDVYLRKVGALTLTKLPENYTKEQFQQELQNINNAQDFLLFYLTHNASDLSSKGVISSAQKNQLDNLFMQICKYNPGVQYIVQNILQEAAQSGASPDIAFVRSKLKFMTEIDNMVPTKEIKDDKFEAYNDIKNSREVWVSELNKQVDQATSAIASKVKPQALDVKAKVQEQVQTSKTILTHIDTLKQKQNQKGTTTLDKDQWREKLTQTPLDTKGINLRDPGTKQALATVLEKSFNTVKAVYSDEIQKAGEDATKARRQYNEANSKGEDLTAARENLREDRTTDSKAKREYLEKTSNQVNQSGLAKVSYGEGGFGQMETL